MGDNLRGNHGEEIPALFQIAVEPLGCQSPTGKTGGIFHG